MQMRTGSMLMRGVACATENKCCADRGVPYANGFRIMLIRGCLWLLRIWGVAYANEDRSMLMSRGERLLPRIARLVLVRGVAYANESGFYANEERLQPFGGSGAWPRRMRAGSM